MAMNKKETAALEAAEREARIARALRWSDATDVPPDMPIPSGSVRFSTGWELNAHTSQVTRAWSEINLHGAGEYERPSRLRHASQEGILLYSTEERALRALRVIVERASAEQLADIDRRLAAIDRGVMATTAHSAYTWEEEARRVADEAEAEELAAAFAEEARWRDVDPEEEP